jgi:hypothetical protein
MSDGQEAKLNMYQRTVELCRNNAEIYANVANIKKAVEQLANIIPSIREAAQRQESIITGGYSAEKQKATDTLVEYSMKIANAVYVYAIDKDDKILQSKVSVNKSMFYAGHANDVYTLAKNIYIEAKKHLSELADYGIVENDLALLDNAFPIYEDVINKPRIAKENRAVYTKNLKELFAYADSLLYDRLDKLVILFKTSAPDFYFAYKNARNVINVSRRNKKEEEKE